MCCTSLSGCLPDCVCMCVCVCVRAGSLFIYAIYCARSCGCYRVAIDLYIYVGVYGIAYRRYTVAYRAVRTVSAPLGLFVPVLAHLECEQSHLCPTGDEFVTMEDFAAIYLDISKYFDKIWHAGLLNKCKHDFHIPNPTFDWLKSYLSKTAVSANNAGRQVHLY